MIIYIELDHIVRGGEPQLRTRGMIASRSLNMVRHPRGSYIVIPTAVSGVATPKKEHNSLALSTISKKVGTRCRSPPYERFLEGCSAPFMRLAEHLTALRALVQAMSAWSMKTRRAPSRGIVGMQGSMVIRLRPCTK